MYVIVVNVVVVDYSDGCHYYCCCCCLGYTSCLFIVLVFADVLALVWNLLLLTLKFCVVAL